MLVGHKPKRGSVLALNNVENTGFVDGNRSGRKRVYQPRPRKWRRLYNMQ
jgi:hypothetical protein